MSHDQHDLSELRQAFAAPGPATGDCPPPERLWSATRGELPAAERDALLDHLASCPACSEDWRLATAFAHEGDAGGEAEVVPLRRPGVRRVVPWLTAAAAAGLLVVVGAELQERRPERTVVAERGDTAAALGSPLDGGVLLRGRPRLWWHGVAGATGYDVEVLTEDLEPVAAEQGLVRPEYVIPAPALAGLPRGTKLHWIVVAALPDGGTVRSDTFVTELR